MQREVEILYNPRIFAGIVPADLIVNNLFRENRNVYVFSFGSIAPGEVNFLPSGSTAAVRSNIYFIHASRNVHATRKRLRFFTFCNINATDYCRFRDENWTPLPLSAR